MQSIFVSTVAWVSKGFARHVPKQLTFTQEQVQQMKRDPLVQKHLNKDIDKINQIDIQQDMQEQGLPTFTPQFTQLKDEGNYPMAIEDMEDEEKEDYYIKETDALIIAGKVDKEYASLEVYIYQQDRNNLYVHHEIMMSAFPLDIEWLNTDIGSLQKETATKGNYAIVGTFLSEIEIWDIDLADAIEPTMVLGGEVDSKSTKPKKFKNKAKKYKPGSHTDSVLSVSLNRFHKNILASGSSDTTVKIWDLVKAQNIYTLQNHKDRVVKVDWSPVEQTIMMTGSFDKTIQVMDSRFPNDKIVKNIESLEGVCWNIENPSQIAYTTQQGYFCLFDAKAPNKNIFSIKAHNDSATGCRIGHNGLAVTCSQDGFVKVWDIKNMPDNKPQLIHTQNPKCGKLFCVQMYQDSQVICCGNSSGQLFVWDMFENKKIEQHFGAK